MRQWQWTGEWTRWSWILAAGGLLALGSCGFLPLAVNALEQTGLGCTPLPRDRALSGSLQSVNAETVELAQFNDGIQAVFLSNRATATETETMARRLELEFGQYSFFRQVVVVDGRGWRAFQKFVVSLVRNQLPYTSGSPYVGFDFEGSLVEDLTTIAESAVSGRDVTEHALLFIISGDGKVSSVYALDNGSSLAARQCLRAAVREVLAQSEDPNEVTSASS